MDKIEKAARLAAGAQRRLAEKWSVAGEHRGEEAADRAADFFEAVAEERQELRERYNIPMASWPAQIGLNRVRRPLAAAMEGEACPVDLSGTEL